MVEKRQLKESKSIHRRTGKTFYFATRLLPERTRQSTYVLYAFFRIADEVVDDEGAQDVPDELQAEKLERLRAEAKGERDTDDPVLSAFQEIKAEYGIPDEEIDLFVDAMATDIDRSRYDTYEDLEAYMRGSASAVGAMMTAIMEPDDREQALPHAVALGKAFQMTNFLRDVREDVVDRDRIYLPLETLESHGVSGADVDCLRFSEGFAAAVSEELRRTERLYREGVAGIKYLPEDCQFAVLLASVLYAEYHRMIRSQGYDVLSKRPSLSTARKVWLLAKTRWHWTWNKDPEAVFRRVSAVPDTERGVPEREHGEGIPTP
jgi:phytoene synthase